MTLFNTGLSIFTFSLTVNCTDGIYIQNRYMKLNRRFHLNWMFYSFMSFKCYSCQTRKLLIEKRTTQPCVGRISVKTWNAYKKMKMGKMSRPFVVGQQ